MDIQNQIEHECQWKTREIVAKKGLMTGCDDTLEYMLGWWLENVRKYSSLPICFFDFGLSDHVRKWCQKQGLLIQPNIPTRILKKRINNPPKVFLDQKPNLEELARFQKKRIAWFTKPFALLNTPFEHSVWLDVDCEVQKDLGFLFEILEKSTVQHLSSSPAYKIKLKIERDKILKQDERAYNSGVIPFRRKSELIKKWAQATCEYEGDFLGDQDVLNRLINDINAPIDELPKDYNWRPLHWGKNKEAVIQHWSGATKAEIRQQVMLNPKLRKFWE